MLARDSVHQERLEPIGLFQRSFEHRRLILQLLAEGGAMADGLGEELLFHTPLILEKEFSAAVIVKITTAIPLLKVVWLENLVAEKVQCQSLNEHRAEWLDEIERQRPASILRGVQGAQRGVEAMRVEESHCLLVEKSRAEA